MSRKKRLQSAKRSTSWTSSSAASNTHPKAALKSHAPPKPKQHLVPAVPQETRGLMFSTHLPIRLRLSARPCLSKNTNANAISRKLPNPAGGERRRSADGHHYVIQKHAASRLHYDFRLELDGTLKSWAVPKGPSLDPAVKSLAVQVEDHPLEYAKFEGIIPKGEYGGGTVMVWDQGTWEPEVDAAEGLQEGKLKFELHGEKLHGSWALVRRGGRAGDGGKNWLLIKHKMTPPSPRRSSMSPAREPRSVVTDRDLDEIASDSDAIWSSRSKAAHNGHHKSATKSPPQKTITRKTKTKTKLNVNVAELPGARHYRAPKTFQTTTRDTCEQSSRRRKMAP